MKFGYAFTKKESFIHQLKYQVFKMGEYIYTENHFLYRISETGHF